MFCRRANLAHLLALPQCPAVLKEAWSSISRSLNLKDLDTGGSKRLTHSFHQTKQSKLDEDIQAALLSFLYPTLSKADQDKTNLSTVFKLPYYQVERGVTYSAFDRSVPHSLVYFRKSSHVSTHQLFPGQVRLIFRYYHWVGDHLTDGIFVALHEFQPVQLKRDPFSSYPEFRAGIYHKEPLASVRIILIGDIHCHANHRPWDASSVVMRAIDRVGPLLYFPYNCLTPESELLNEVLKGHLFCLMYVYR